MDDWKIIILRRYCGEYPPADKPATALKKSSDDIAFDLSGMGSYSPDEVSAYMAVNGYTIAFDDGKPVWLLQPRFIDKALTE